MNRPDKSPIIYETQSQPRQCPCRRPTPRAGSLRIYPSTAKTVCVAGTFNHWQPEAKTLHASGTGLWWKETALAPGTYEYCLVVDGHWMPDPLARETGGQPFWWAKLSP